MGEGAQGVKGSRVQEFKGERGEKTHGTNFVSRGS